MVEMMGPVYHKARELAIEQVTFRVQGTLTQLKWSKPIDSDSKGPEVILSPGQDFPVRVLARGPARTGKAGRVHVVMWMPLQASSTPTWPKTPTSITLP